MQTNLVLKEKIQANQNQLPAEAAQILEILGKIEEHTAELRRKLMDELKPAAKQVNLKLDNVNNQS